MKVALLGPQRFDPNVADVAEALGVKGTIALVTAGWQEREPEDQELSEHLGGRTVNLRLHRRADAVFAKDPEFRAAYRARQLRYRQLQDFYRIRLEHLMQSAQVIAHRSAEPELLAEEKAASVDAIRVLDRHHQRRCAEVRREFNERFDPASRSTIARHRAEVAKLLDGCAALAIAGGQVASLLNRVHMFAVAEAVAERPVIAWSAGAMAVTEQVVLFHDDPPHGIDAPQILDVGLSLVRGVVALPNPHDRLALDDTARMMMYAQRFRPATCLALPRRAWILMDGAERGASEGVLELLPDGAVRALEAA